VPSRSERSTVVVVDSFPQVSQTFVVDHIRGLAANDWEVHVAARQVDREGLEALGFPAMDVRVHALSAPSRGQLLARAAALARVAGVRRGPLLRSVSLRSASYFAPALRSLVAAVEPAVLHAHFAHNGLLAAMVAGRDLPVIVTFHGYDVLVLPHSEGWDGYRAFLGDCHGVVHSSFLEEHVGRHLRCSLSRVTLGVDGELFKGAERGDAWSDPLALVTVGRLVPQKGHQVAIEALAHLRSAPTPLDATLTIIGDGPERTRLLELAQRHGVIDRVRFLGPRPSEEVARTMAASDVLLIPSIRFGAWQESFCRVAVEGLASGMAVIGTSTGGLAETIGEGGFVVSPDDPEALAAELISLVTEEVPRDVALRARKRASQFSLRSMWDDYAALAARVAAEAHA
jgi:colanic acid/amylovoran biosynthesis glycosyltransferase